MGEPEEPIPAEVLEAWSRGEYYIFPWPGDDAPKREWPHGLTFKLPEGKPLKFENVVIAIADGTPDSEGEMFDVADIELPGEPVSIRIDFDIARHVGFAYLRKDGNRILATLDVMDINYADKVKGLTPALSGSYTFKKKCGDGTKCGCKIVCVGLCTSGNADKRIPTL